MERTAFPKFFKRKIGITTNEFLPIMRMKRAVQPMGESDRSVTEVAYSVGFQSLATFERIFKKHTGVTPSAFRRMLLEERGIVRKSNLRPQTDDTQPTIAGFRPKAS